MAKGECNKSCCPPIKELASRVKVRDKNCEDWNELVMATASLVDARDGDFQRLEKRLRDPKVVLTAEERAFLADYIGGKIKRAAHRPAQSRVARKRGLAGRFLAIALKEPGKSTDEIADELRKKFKHFDIELEGLSSTVLREMIARLRKLPEPLGTPLPLDDSRKAVDAIIETLNKRRIASPSRTPEQQLVWERAAIEDGIRIAERSGNEAVVEILRRGLATRR